MFIVFIAPLVMILIVMQQLSIQSLMINQNSPIIFKKVEFVFEKEKVLKNSVDIFIQSKDSIPVNIAAIKIDDFLTDSFTDNNEFGGTFSFSIVDNNTTLRVTHDISDTKIRNIYLSHYRGREYGTPPIDLGNNLSVQHDIPLNYKSVASLNNL
jgi:hypothetical protein